MIQTLPITSKVKFRGNDEIFNVPEFVLNNHIREMLLSELMRQLDKFVWIQESKYSDPRFDIIEFSATIEIVTGRD